MNICMNTTVDVDIDFDIHIHIIFLLAILSQRDPN